MTIHTEVPWDIGFVLCGSLSQKVKHSNLITIVRELPLQD